LQKADVGSETEKKKREKEKKLKNRNIKNKKMRKKEYPDRFLSIIDSLVDF